MSNILHQPCFLRTSSDIPPATMQVIAILNSTLATAVDLKTQIKQAYWNVVTGSNCEPLRELLAEIATQLEEYIDIFAEQIKALGGLAIATARVAAQVSLLPDYPHHIVNDIDHVTALAQQLTLFAQSLLQSSMQAAQWGDFDTDKLYTEIFRVIEQRLWLLTAHLQAAQAQENG